MKGVVATAVVAGAAGPCTAIGDCGSAGLLGVSDGMSRGGGPCVNKQNIACTYTRHGFSITLVTHGMSTMHDC